MASSFKVEVLTPEGQVFSDEVEMVSTRTTTGSIGIKARHAPLMAILEPTELRLYKSDSDVVRFAQGEGYLQVVDNQALVLVEEAIPPDEIDRGAFESRLKEAQQQAERCEDGSEEKARAEREVKRYEAFLEVGPELAPGSPICGFSVRAFARSRGLAASRRRAARAPRSARVAAPRRPLPSEATSPGAPTGPRRPLRLR